MSELIFLIGLLAFVALGLFYFASAPPAQIVRNLRLVGPALIVLAGVILSLTGRFAAGAPLILMALAWYRHQRRFRGRGSTRGRKSMVRSAWLEMELDHDTGGLDGTVLVGPFEGRRLDAMGESELRVLAADLNSDRESAELLEAYLDRRMPGWRDNADTNTGPRQAGPHGSGAMTEEEAYKVLGLEPGASAVEIRQAHRGLMQRVHPDLGGNAFLAQRVNEARDILLRDHADKDP